MAKNDGQLLVLSKIFKSIHCEFQFWLDQDEKCILENLKYYNKI